MARDPMVDLIFSHFIPRYVATGVDHNDLQRMMKRIDQWSEWCHVWSEEAKLHEIHAAESAARGRRTTAAESYLRAAIYYHYGKHLFADPPEEFRAAHDNMIRCYTAAAADTDPPMQRLVFPFNGAQMFGWLRVPPGVKRPPVAIVLPGLDAGAVGIVGQSLGAFYAPLAAAGEPRIKACIANCGPFDFAPVIAQMPEVSKQVFRASLDMSRLYLGDQWNTAITGIPYPGGPQIFNALAAGDIDMAVLGAYGGLSLLKSGKVKLLAVSGSKRLAAFPNVPTLNELGLGDFPSGQSWWGLLGPAGMSDAVTQRINSEFLRTFREPKFAAFLAELITEPNVGTPEQFGALIRSDRERIAKLIRQYKWSME